MGTTNSTELFTKEDKRRLFAVVIPSLCGKTQLTKNMNTLLTNKTFVDLDEFALTVFNVSDLNSKDQKTQDLIVFPPLKVEISKLLKNWKDQDIILVTGNINFIRYLEIKPKRTSVYIPEEKLYQTVIEGYTELKKSIKDFPEREEAFNKELAKIKNSRNTLLLEKHETFNTWDELANKTLTKFKTVK